jgi:hypothetical protein
MTSQSWWWVAVALVVVLGVAFYTAHVGYRDEQLRRNGVAATARVVAVKQTGTWSGNNPEVDLSLEISRPGEAPYAHTLRTVVPVVNAPAVQPGTVIRLKIDANDRSRIVIDEPWAGAGS